MSSSYGQRMLRYGLQQTARRTPRADPTSWRQTFGGGYASHLHTFALNRHDREDEQKERQRHVRLYHSSPPSEREEVAILMGLGTLSALAYAGSSAAKSYEEWKAAQPTPEELEEMRKAEEAERQETEASQAKSQADEPKKDAEPDQPRENFFKTFFDVGTKYYEGGFEDSMTKREAALILGIRESASPKRIKDAHRKLLILNHPDTGGSTYLAGKLNEAKELLLKGKARV